MDIVKVFGTNVKRYRQAMGISQEAFAEKCGLHRTYISAIECFRRSISLENIQRIEYECAEIFVTFMDKSSNGSYTKVYFCRYCILDNRLFCT